MASGRYVVVAHTEDGIVVPSFRAWGPFYEWLVASNIAIKAQGLGFDAEIITLGERSLNEVLD